MKQRPANAKLSRLVGAVASPLLIASAACIGPAAAQDVTSISQNVSVSDSTSPIILASWLQPYANRVGAPLDLAIASYVKYQETRGPELHSHDKIDGAYCEREFADGAVLCSKAPPPNAIIAAGRTIPSTQAASGFSR